MASTNALVEDKSSSCAVLAAEQLVRTLISITKIDNKATATDLLLASAELYDDSAESAAIVIVRFLRAIICGLSRAILWVIYECVSDY